MINKLNPSVDQNSPQYHFSPIFPTFLIFGNTISLSQPTSWIPPPLHLAHRIAKLCLMCVISECGAELVYNREEGDIGPLFTLVSTQSVITNLFFFVVTETLSSITEF